jgi:cysteine desulfurase
MIYLDYQATTPLAPEAREAMLHWLGADGFANPHSPHSPAAPPPPPWRCARSGGGLLPPGGNVIFTSGATEAINLAIQGLCPRRIAVSAIEHAAVGHGAHAGRWWMYCRYPLTVWCRPMQRSRPIPAWWR